LLCPSKKKRAIFRSACRGKEWHAHTVPFSLCLSRKRLSWEHGVRLRFTFPPACRRKVCLRTPPPQEAQERPFSEDSGRQHWPLANAFSPSETGKRQIANCFCLFAIAFCLYLSRKMQFQSSSGLNSTDLQTVSLGGLNPHGLKTVSSSSHVMRTCDGTNIFRVRWGAHWMPSYAGTTPTAVCLLSDEPRSTI
jgi:hypothetical protein